DHTAFLAAVLALQDLDHVILLDVDAGHLQHLRGERDDLHEPLLAQFAGNRPEDARAAGVLLFVEDHDRVVVETDVGAVGPSAFLRGANDDRADALALLHGTAGERVLHGADDHVADARVAASGPAEDADTQDLFGPGVVRHLAARLLLDQPLLPAPGLPGPLHDLDHAPALGL